jgi:pimeloyl-ACP methyl ester carboxylesterase
MPVVRSADYLINYEITCSRTGPTLLLVAGLGEQIGTVEFPEEQCQHFAALGYQVIRMDNRGTGLSRPIGGTDESSSAFTLLDMADDVAAVIRDLNVGPVHLLGASMAGFIARWTAIRHAELVRTLTVVMSGSGAGPGDNGPQLDPALRASSMDMVKVRPPAEAVEFGVGIWRFLWGNGYPFEEDWVRERVRYGVNRAYRPHGVEKALHAIMSTPGLWAEQTKIKQPTLFVHGALDPCFSLDHGVESAKQIRRARIWVDSKMGHIMHREQWDELAQRVRQLADEARAVKDTPEKA